MFRKKSSESSSCNDKDYVEPDVVEELYEEGSAMLSERSTFVTTRQLITCSLFFSPDSIMFV